MTASGTAPYTPQAVRRVHRAMAAGMILYAIVAHFVVLPNASPPNQMSNMLPLLLALSLAGCAISFVIATRVPKPAPGEAGDAFWQRSARATLIAWSFLEGSGLLAIVAYSNTGSTAEIAIAILVLATLLLMNPGYFERR
jgi:FtsH-binding integral membrane protein